jgi:hypothetical protein
MLATYRKEYYDGASFPHTLAQRGYAVIVIDMFYHGERRLILDEDLENRTNDRSKAEPEEALAVSSWNRCALSSTLPSGIPISTGPRELPPHFAISRRRSCSL